MISPVMNMQHPMVTATANITMMDIPLGIITPFEFCPSVESVPKRSRERYFPIGLHYLF